MPNLTLTFTVQNGGSPVEGATVRLGAPLDLVLTTDADGEAPFVCPPLLDSPIAIQIDKNSFSFGIGGVRLNAQTMDGLLYDVGVGRLSSVAAIESLARSQALKNAAIDRRTRELITAGFTYDSNTFSLSADAQKNWIGAEVTKASLSYPLKISTIDDGEYSIANALDLTTFYLAGVAAKQGHLDSGRVLKIQVNAASTIAEVDAIEDTR